MPQWMGSGHTLKNGTQHLTTLISLNWRTYMLHRYGVIQKSSRRLWERSLHLHICCDSTFYSKQKLRSEWWQRRKSFVDITFGWERTQLWVFCFVRYGKSFDLILVNFGVDKIGAPSVGTTCFSKCSIGRRTENQKVLDRKLVLWSLTWDLQAF